MPLAFPRRRKRKKKRKNKEKERRKIEEEKLASEDEKNGQEYEEGSREREKETGCDRKGTRGASIMMQINVTRGILRSASIFFPRIAGSLECANFFWRFSQNRLGKYLCARIPRLDPGQSCSRERIKPTCTR